MILRQRFMPGFKGSSRWADAATSSFYYKQYPAARAVLCVSNLCPWEVSLFSLTREQFRSFVSGDLSLIPPGCCNPSGGRSVQGAKILRGEQEPENHAEILAFVRKMETKHKLQ